MPCSAHDHRRSFETALLDVGEDMITAQRLAWHAARYDRRGERAKRRAVQSLDLPRVAA